MSQLVEAHNTRPPIGLSSDVNPNLEQVNVIRTKSEGVERKNTRKSNNSRKLDTQE